MTNLEWLKNNDYLLERILKYRLALVKGKPDVCEVVDCKGCDFSDSDSCYEARKEWLKAEYEPLYKKGDIILTNKGTLEFVIREAGNNVVICNCEKDIDNCIEIEIYISKEDIKKKVGNIYDK